MPKSSKKKNKNVDDLPNRISEVFYGPYDDDSAISVNSGNTDRSNITEVNTIDKEAQLLQSICDSCEKLSESNTTIRMTNLKYLYNTFQRNVFTIDETWNYCDTLLDGLERVIRKGKFEEQRLAIDVLTNFLIQVGVSFVDKSSLKVKEMVEPLYRDTSYAFSVRQAALNAICVTFILSTDVNWKDVLTSMEYIETIFRGSYLKGDGSHPVITVELFQLHITALDCWSVLFTMIPSTMILDLIAPLLSKFHQLLKSLNVDLRISAGSLLALIYERVRQEVNSRFKGNGYSCFIEELELLAKDGSKSRAKIERKKQRQSFRDILTAVQSETVEFPISKIQFGTENLELNSWCMKARYDVLCDVLETGINRHLQQNVFIRELFDLGLPINVDKLEAKQSKMSHKERNLANQANSKVRKQALQFCRTKRMHVNNIHLND